MLRKLNLSSLFSVGMSGSRHSNICSFPRGIAFGGVGENGPKQAIVAMLWSNLCSKSTDASSVAGVDWKVVSKFCDISRSYKTFQNPNDESSPGPTTWKGKALHLLTLPSFIPQGLKKLPGSLWRTISGREKDMKLGKNFQPGQHLTPLLTVSLWQLACMYCFCHCEDSSPLPALSKTCSCCCSSVMPLMQGRVQQLNSDCMWLQNKNFAGAMANLVSRCICKGTVNS